MILSDVAILDRLNNPTTCLEWEDMYLHPTLGTLSNPNPFRIEIEPFIESDLQGASVDLRLGREVIYRGNNVEIDAPGTPHGRTILIPPGGSCLAVTSARVHIPHDCVGRVEGKSSIGRQFVVIHCTAGWLDPGFDGFITLELANLSNLTSFLLECDMPICQITFIKMDQPAQRQYKGKYQNAKGVEAHKR